MVVSKASKGKGKQVVTCESSKRKRKEDDSDEYRRKTRSSSGVLQFFDVSAKDASDNDSDWGDDDDEEEEGEQSEDDFRNSVNTEMRDKTESGKSSRTPLFVKEEDVSDGELERWVDERYKTGSRSVYHTEDKYEGKEPTTSADRFAMPSSNDPVVWKVKCVAGRERHVAFCLIQKFVDLQSVGRKLKIVSAFSLEHIKGHIYIEAYNERDIQEACSGLSSVHFSRISRVPQTEVSHLFTVQKKKAVIPVGTWVRVKFGNYKGDLAQVVSVAESNKKATVRLVPRIDLQALANKLAGGPISKDNSVPTPKLISSRDLERLRPHIRNKRDSQTGIVFETIDGLMIKDGFLYKNVSVDSLTYASVVPSPLEIQRFTPCEEEENANVEWLSQLYDGRLKQNLPKNARGTSKGSTNTSGNRKGDGFQLHDLVFFGPNDIGVIIAVEGDNFQVLKDNVDEAEVVSVELHELKNGPANKFGTLDKHLKNLNLNDNIRVLEGRLEGRQGYIKQIYKGTIFIYDESQLENGGYFCVKSHLCESIIPSNDSHPLREGNLSGGGLAFENSYVSPTDMLAEPSHSKPWQARENNREFNNQRRGDKEGMFSTGQTVRIRVGPLKGYLGRVMAIYRSDITIKLSSQMRTVTVKLEHITEAGVKKSVGGLSSGVANSFGGCGTGSEGFFGEGAGDQADSGGWNSGAAPSSATDTWGSFPPASDFLLGSSSANPFGSVNMSSDSKQSDIEADVSWGIAVPKTVTDSGWGNSGAGGNNESSWNNMVEAQPDDAENWGKKTDDWGGGNVSTVHTSDEMNGWGTAKIPSELAASCSHDAGDSWSKAVEAKGKSIAESEPCGWGKIVEDIHISTAETETGGWGEAVEENDKTTPENESTGWGKAAEDNKIVTETETSGWGVAVEDRGKSSAENETCGWGKVMETEASGNSAWGKGGIADTETSGWGNVVETGIRGNTNHLDQDNSWGKAVENVNNQNGASKDKSGSWGITQETTKGGTDESTGWNKTSAKNISGWKQSSSINKETENDVVMDEGNGWNIKAFGDAQGSGWKVGACTTGDMQSSGWGQGTAANTETGGSENNDAWSKGQSSADKEDPGWKSGSTDAGGGWGSKITSEGSTKNETIGWGSQDTGSESVGGGWGGGNKGGFEWGGGNSAPNDDGIPKKASSRMTGTVKFFNGTKGFGFITPSDGSDDLFVHQSSIKSEGYRNLAEGEEVEFVVEQGNDGKTRAVDVTGPDGAYVKGQPRESGGGKGRTDGEDQSSGSVSGGWRSGNKGGFGSSGGISAPNDSGSPKEASDRMRGTVKFFNASKGFGFITPSDGSEDLFVHQSSIKSEGYRSLAEGEEVEFLVEQGNGGKTKAVDVTGPDGAYVKGQPRESGGGKGRKDGEDQPSGSVGGSGNKGGSGWGGENSAPNDGGPPKEASGCLTGTVKFFNATKGFGFITPSDGSEDLFVHQSSIKSEGYRSLAEGEEVEFVVEQGNDGKTKAVDVTGPDGAYVKGQPRECNGGKGRTDGEDQSSRSVGGGWGSGNKGGSGWGAGSSALSDGGPPKEASGRMKGTVKFFNGTKGFGFITPNDGSDDLFVHQSSIKSEGYRSLAEGEEVEFVVEQGNDGKTKAVDVTGPDGAYVKGQPRESGGGKERTDAEDQSSRGVGGGWGSGNNGGSGWGAGNSVPNDGGPPKEASGRMKGSVKFFNGTKGFGFITPSDGSEDLFVHQSSIKSKGYRSLAEGEEVEFVVEQGNGGKTKAVDVTGPDGAYVKGQPRESSEVTGGTDGEDQSFKKSGGGWGNSSSEGSGWGGGNSSIKDGDGSKVAAEVWGRGNSSANDGTVAGGGWKSEGSGWGGDNSSQAKDENEQIGWGS